MKLIHACLVARSSSEPDEPMLLQSRRQRRVTFAARQGQVWDKATLVGAGDLRG